MPRSNCRSRRRRSRIIVGDAHATAIGAGVVGDQGIVQGDVTGRRAGSGFQHESATAIAFADFQVAQSQISGICHPYHRIARQCRGPRNHAVCTRRRDRAGAVGESTVDGQRAMRGFDGNNELLPGKGASGKADLVGHVAGGGIGGIDRRLDRRMGAAGAAAHRVDVGKRRRGVQGNRKGKTNSKVAHGRFRWMA